MHTPEQINELRAKIIEHLERARALAEQTGDSAAGFFIQTARDRLTAPPVSALSFRVGGRRHQFAG
jgi:hypothetical protein